MKTTKFHLVFVISLFFLLSGMKAYALDISPRIVGGSTVPDDRYSFMVAMFQDRAGDNDFQFSCGGSYIGSGWVLTAAHCVVNSDNGQISAPSSLLLKYGVRNLNEEGSVVDVQRVVVHPDYNIATSEADIALLQLDSRLPTPFITLPSNSDSFPDVDGEARVAGWGTTSEGGSISAQLLETTLPLVSQPACLPFYPASLTTDAMICAGGIQEGGQDTCQGDSGGPLFVVRDNLYIQAGIVSFGTGCARPSVPGVYTRLSNYTDWIAQVAPGTPAPLAISEGISDDQTANVAITLLESGNNPQQSTVDLGGVRIFEIDNRARRIELTTITGDADLYVVSGNSFDKDDITCQSILATSLDSCVLSASTGERKFALVFGFVDSTFSIESPMPFDEDPNAGDTLTPSSGGSSGIGFMDWLLMLGLSVGLWFRGATFKQ